MLFLNTASATREGLRHSRKSCGERQGYSSQPITWRERPFLHALSKANARRIESPHILGEKYETNRSGNCRLCRRKTSRRQHDCTPLDRKFEECRPVRSELCGGKV